MNPECRLDSQGKQPRRTHEPSPRQPLTPHKRGRADPAPPVRHGALDGKRRRRFGVPYTGFILSRMEFSPRIVAWQRLRPPRSPWQNTRDPYRIWLSEIMLQQTQVATVIPYYERFLARFPDVAALAAAAQEDVMPYWAGLGYYARARNLHRCAQEIARDWQGRFPPTAEAIATLPGIGRSTAAAIAAFAYGERSPILDGNVKRVFTRHFGIAGDPSKREVEQRLWALADTQVEVAPDLDMAAYTQGLMDLGATLCTRGKPACDKCPVADTCVARREGRQAELPTPRRARRCPSARRRCWCCNGMAPTCCSSGPSPASGAACGACPNSTRPAIPARRPGHWAWNRNGTARWPRSRIPSRTTGCISGRGGWKCARPRCARRPAVALGAGR